MKMSDDEKSAIHLMKALKVYGFDYKDLEWIVFDHLKYREERGKFFSHPSEELDELKEVLQDIRDSKPI